MMPPAEGTVRAVQKKAAPVERNVRLSESRLWGIMQAFYEGQGVGAWAKVGVPSHITCNTFIARAYARMIAAYLRDISQTLDSAEPFYVFELGAGPGRFSYLLLKELLAAGRAFPNIRYVMTDLASRNVDYWQTHTRLRGYFERGVLDRAQFNAADFREIRLCQSGEVLAAGTVKNPIAAIANYVFDSLPQDAFLVEEGQLHENLLTLYLPETAEDMLSRAQIQYAPNLARADYYDDPLWNRLLGGMRDRLPSSAFLFPVGALRAIESLRRICGDRLLLISADKGYRSDQAIIEGSATPAMARHGGDSFSMMVDYGLIGESFEARGGQVLHPGQSHQMLNISAFVAGQAGTAYTELTAAYEEYISSFGPDDFFSIMQGLEEQLATMTVERALAYLRLSAWDYRLLWMFLPVFKANAAALGDELRREVRRAIREVWSAYYPIGEEDDLAFQLGVLLLEMDSPRDALEFLHYSEELYGLEPGTAYNMGACHFHLGELEAATECLERALKLNPAFDAARALKARIQAR